MTRPPRRSLRGRAWVIAAAAACIAGAVWLQARSDFQIPVGRAPTDAGPSARAVRTERTLAQHRAVGADSSPLVISEVMTDNPATLLDEQRSAPDWIELWNRSERPLALGGWSLADGRDAGSRWPLPDVLVPAGAFQIVWASGGNRVGSRASRLLALRLHPDAEEALRVDADHPRPPPASLKHDPPTLRQVELTIDVPEAGRWTLWLGLRALDPWAELDVQVAEAPLKTLRLEARRRLQHVRLAAAGRDGFALPAGAQRILLRPRRGGLHVERVSLTRDAPAGDPYAPALHAGFRLRRTGETVALLDPSGQARDYVTPPEAEPDRSYQRSASGFRLALPSPLGRSRIAAADLSPLPSLSPTPIEVRLPRGNGAPRWRYSRDGSLPGPNHPELPESLRIAETGVLRIRGFRDGEPVTAVTTRQFWIGPPPELPVALLALDPFQLDDPDSGILPHNGWRGRDWERRGHAVLLDADGVLNDGDVGIRTHAGTGAMHGRSTSLRMYWRPAYGSSGPRRDPFEPASAVVPKRVVLDATGGSWIDKIAYDMVRSAGGMAPRTAVGLVYLNGDFYNLATWVETVDERFLRGRFGHTDFDLIKGKPFEGKRGSLERFHALAKRLQPRDFDAADVAADMDLDALVSLHFAQLFMEASEAGKHHKDALQGYLAFDRSQAPSRLIPIGWDLDHSFRHADYDMLGGQLREIAPRKFKTRFLPALTVLHLLSRDDAFRARYRARAEQLLDEVFAAPRWQAEVARILALHLRYVRPSDARPGDPDFPAKLAEARDWKRSVFARVDAFMDARPDVVRAFLAEHLASGGGDAVSTAGAAPR